MKILFSSTCIFLILILSPASNAARQINVQDAFDIFWHEMRDAEKLSTSQQRAIAVAKSYEHYIAPITVENIKRLSTADLHLLLQAARAKVAYLQAEDGAQFARAIGTELAARNELKSSEANDITQFLVITRQLSLARSWSHSSGSTFNIPSVRDFHSSDIHSEWLLAQQHGEIFHKDFEFPSGPYVIIVSHPLCHFSENAVEAIKNDTDISNALHGRVKWLVPQQLNFYVDEFRRWNTENPDQQLSLAYRNNEWPEVSSWATPTFYFFTSGKLVSSFAGWPAKGNREELLAHMRGVNMISSNQVPNSISATRQR